MTTSAASAARRARPPSASHASAGAASVVMKTGSGASLRRWKYSFVSEAGTTDADEHQPRVHVLRVVLDELPGVFGVTDPRRHVSDELEAPRQRARMSQVQD